LFLLLLGVAARFLFSAALRSLILVLLILIWLAAICLAGLAAVLAAIFSPSAAALSVCDVAGTDQQCHGKRRRRCEVLVIHFH
jgi:hypothetical protein